MRTYDYLKAAAALNRLEMDGLRLYRPTDPQAEGLRALAKENIFEAMIVGGNRSGKTLLAAAFVASYLRDEPITCWDGSEIHCRPDRERGKPVNVWIIGDHLKHIGMTLYRMLFQGGDTTGAFKIIRDETTTAWRAWHPERFATDMEREDETQWAPPFILEHMIVGWDWAPGRKTAHEFRKFTLTNNAVAYGMASSGEVKQGDRCNLIWNDENIVNKWYYQEWQSRLRDDEGMLLWSTIPRDECYVFNTRMDAIDAHREEIIKGERSEEEQRLERIELSFLDNPYIKDRQKELSLVQLGDRDAMVRIFGQRASRLIAVYQDYNPGYHCAWYEEDDLNDAVSERLKSNNWVPPADWTRELVLDPGTQKPCILLCAVPPPLLWDDDEPYLVVYREIYDGRLSPDALAARVQATEVDFMFERFIIDGRMGRQRPPGFVETVQYQYTKAFRAARLASHQTGHEFIAGDDDFVRRSGQVIRSLRTRKCGRPQLRILNQGCPHLVRQMSSNVRKTDPEGRPLEQPADNQPDDARCCLEYWISRRPTYRHRAGGKPDVMDPAEAAYRRIVRDWEDRRARQGPGGKTIEIGVPA
jgi:hypothetical protein